MPTIKDANAKEVIAFLIKAGPSRSDQIRDELTMGAQTLNLAINHIRVKAGKDAIKAETRDKPSLIATYSLNPTAGLKKLQAEYGLSGPQRVLPRAKVQAKVKDVVIPPASPYRAGFALTDADDMQDVVAEKPRCYEFVVQAKSGTIIVKSEDGKLYSLFEIDV